jgi:TRAP-type C4-dicarboxylate transport system permease small subunit
MKKIRLQDFDLYIGSFVFTVLVLLIIVNVTARNIFILGWAWVEELIMILFAWASYLGISSSFRYDRHMRIEFIYNFFPKGIQKILDILIDLAVTILGCYIVYLGIIMCINVGNKHTLAMRLPYNVINICLVVSFIVIAVSSMVRVIQRIRGTYVKKDPFANEIPEMGV